MAVPSELAQRLLVECGRHCCLCRRFRPTLLQVHHIVPISEGGSDEIDNLIVLCITCHSDVHTKVPFTRRFTVEELRQHRDAVRWLVSEGRLPQTASSSITSIDNLSGRRVKDVQHASSVARNLSQTALEVIVLAANDEHGQFFAGYGITGWRLSIVDESTFNDGGPRSIAKYKDALRQLEAAQLIVHLSASTGLYEVTHSGYLLADEISAAAHQDSNG